MGIHKIHPIVAVAGALIQEEDAPGYATCTQIQDTGSSSSSVGLSLIEEALDRMIQAYTNFSNKNGGIVDVNQELDAIVKVIDMCNRVEDKLIEDVKAYQALLTSVVRDSCASTSPRILAASSRALASAASHQVGIGRDLRLNNELSSVTASLEDVMQQSHSFLESLSRGLTLTVCHPKKPGSLRRAFEKVLKKKSSKQDSGIRELKRVDDLVKMMSAEDRQETKLALAGDLKDACQDLKNGISKLRCKINLLHACLVKTRVALLDILTYSS